MTIRAKAPSAEMRGSAAMVPRSTAAASTVMRSASAAMATMASAPVPRFSAVTFLS